MSALLDAAAQQACAHCCCQVYRLNPDGLWDDKGTGHVSVEFMEVRLTRHRLPARRMFRQSLNMSRCGVLFASLALMGFLWL